MSATLQARALVTELIRAGVTDLVIAPGSRNGPISLAALAANQLNVTVRIDERSTAFTALGIAKVTGRKVAVAVTSGTAGAHLLPALIEAAQSDIEFIAITADRPKSLINTGANQTIEQLELFAAATKNVIDLDSDWPAEMWQNEIKIGLAKPGVVHLNPRFTEPLIPTDEWQFSPIETTQVEQELISISAASFLNGKRGVVISSGEEIQVASEISQKLNWPLIAEPCGTVHSNLIASGSLVAAQFKEEIEIVVTVGRAGLSRTINSIINNKPRVAIRVPNSLTNLTAKIKTSGTIDLTELSGISHDWLNRWQDAAETFSQNVIQVLSDSHLSGLDVADALLKNLKPANQLFAAASLSLRDLDYLMRPNSAGMILANRGVNGIDGIVSSALGAAIAWQRNGKSQSYCLLGDVALLHDLSSLTIPATEAMPNLRLIVIDNNGGGVFSTIEQRGVVGFERVFGTPHSAELVKLLNGFGIPTIEITSKFELSKIFDEVSGLSAVVVSGIDREVEADLRKQIVNLVH